MGASRRIIVFEDFCCYDAGKIVREVAKVTGGGGGGKPNMAHDLPPQKLSQFLC
jgi:alanyl-tRNA synthetase